MPYICVSEYGQHWFRWWLAAYSAPSHHLNQCNVIINWTLVALIDKLMWKFNQNTKLFIHGNKSLNIVSYAKWRPYYPMINCNYIQCFPQRPTCVGWINERSLGYTCTAKSIFVCWSVGCPVCLLTILRENSWSNVIYFLEFAEPVLRRIFLTLWVQLFHA